MSWGIDFKADIYLDKQDYQENMYQVIDTIEEYEKDIVNYEKSILIHCAANLKDIVPEEWKDDSAIWLNNTITEMVNEIQTISKDIYKLKLYKKYLEKLEDIHIEIKPIPTKIFRIKELIKRLINL